jgi:hypothetical protein
MYEDYTTTTAARTVLAEETGMIFYSSSISNDPVTFNLPAARAGLRFTFVDLDATAAADLHINPDDADSINLGTAGVDWVATGDAVGEVTTVEAVDGVNWLVTNQIGTWAAGS